MAGPFDDLIPTAAPRPATAPAAAPRAAANPFADLIPGAQAGLGDLVAPPSFDNVVARVDGSEAEQLGLGDLIAEAAQGGLLQSVGGRIQAIAESVQAPFAALEDTVLGDLVAAPVAAIAPIVAGAADAADLGRQKGAAARVGAINPTSVDELATMALADPAGAGRLLLAIGAESAPGILEAMATRNPQAATALMGFATGGQTFGQQRADGVGLYEALQRSTASGLMEAAGSRATMDEVLAGGAPLLTRAIKAPLLEAAGEGATGSVQAVAEGGDNLADRALLEGALGALVGGPLGLGEAALGKGPTDARPPTQAAAAPASGSPAAPGAPIVAPDAPAGAAGPVVRRGPDGVLDLGTVDGDDGLGDLLLRNLPPEVVDAAAPIIEAVAANPELAAQLGDLVAGEAAPAPASTAPAAPFADLVPADAPSAAADLGDLAAAPSEAPAPAAPAAAGGSPAAAGAVSRGTAPSIDDLIAGARAKKARATTLAADAGPDGSVAFTKGDGQRALAGPDMSKPGAFRLTRFDRDGQPFGHAEFPTLAAAAEYALLEGGFTPDAPAPKTPAPEQLGDMAVGPGPLPAPARRPVGFLRKEIGWAEIGGRMLRARQDGDSDPENFDQRNSGDVIGRTPWVPHVDPGGRPSAFWRERPGRITEREAAAAIDAYEAGQPLTKKQQRFIDYAIETADQYDADAREEMASLPPEALGQFADDDVVSGFDGVPAPPQPETDDVPFSRAAPTPPAPGRSSVATASAEVRRVLGPSAERITVVETTADLPDGLASRANDRTEGLFDPATGKTYLIAGNVRPERAGWVAAHEIAGHLGLRGLADHVAFQDVRAYADVLADTLAAAGRNRTVQQVATAIAASEPDYSPQRATEEAIAELAAATRTGNYAGIERRYGVTVPQAQRATLIGAIARVIDALRTLLRRTGASTTDADIYQLLKDAWQHVASNTTTPPMRSPPPRRRTGALASRTAPTFFSAALRAIEQGKGAPKRADAKAWKEWLDGAVRRGDMKQAERDWLGLDAWLEGRGQTTRDELAGFVRANEVQVKDVVLTENGDVPKLSREFDDWLQDSPYADEPPSTIDDWVAIGNDLADQAVGMTDDPDEESRLLELSEEAYAIARGDGPVGDGRTKFGQYTTPGGQNYRELLLTLPDRRVMETEGFAFDYKVERALREKYGRVDPRDWTFAEAEAMTNEGRASDEAFNRHAERATGLNRQTTFTASHFDQPNVLAHVRFNERTDADGKRVLFIEEIQSDWHQKGRKRGYNVERSEAEKAAIRARNAQAATLADVDIDVNEPGVPDAPFKGSDEWAMLAFKRMARWAVDNGFDRIAWTTGDQQNARYDLSKQVDEIRVTRDDNGKRSVAIDAAGNRSHIFMDVDDNGIVVFADSQPELHGKDLADVIGKDMAEKIMAVDGDAEFSGDGLKIGGDGMKGFYDKILPAAVNKWAKKFGGKVEPPARGKWYGYNSSNNLGGPFTTAAEATAAGYKSSQFEQGGGADRHTVNVTDAMRDAVADGQPLFSRAPDAPFAGMTRAEFLGAARLTRNNNAAELRPRALTSVSAAPAEAFAARGDYTARYSEDGAAVYAGDQLVASYNFGDVLAVDKKHRRRGIAAELVYQWRTRYPAPAKTKYRTKAAQAIQEKVWDRIQAEQARRPAGDLFAAPTGRERAEGARRQRDDVRNGRTGSGRTDMGAGDGDLFAGDRPAQGDLDRAGVESTVGLFNRTRGEAAATDPMAPIRRLVDRYDDSDPDIGTVDDLADEIESELADTSPLPDELMPVQRALARLRRDQERSDGFGGRGGDGTERFEDALRKAIAPKPKATVPPKIDPTLPHRPDWTPALERKADLAIDGLIERAGGSVLADRIARDYREAGAAALIGQKIDPRRMGEDLAAMAQAYRNPAWETIRYVFVDGAGVVVGESAVSVRMPASSTMFPWAVVGDAAAFRPGTMDSAADAVQRETAAGVEWIQQQAKRFGASGLWMIHNHPSGDPTPSQADIVVTARMGDELKHSPVKLLGHVVLNHRRYAHINPNGFVAHGDLGTVSPSGPDPLLRNRGQDLHLGAKVDSPQGLAYLGTKMFALTPADSATIITMSAGLNVNTIWTLPNAAIGTVRAKAVFAAVSRRSGGVGAFLVISREAYAKHRDALRSVPLLDVVTIGKDGSATIQTGKGGWPSRFTDPLLGRARRGRRVDRADQGLQVYEPREGDDQTKTPEFRRWFGASVVVDADGRPLPVYHGTKRPDRIGGRFRATRATSGPMAFFTDDPKIASNYAANKSDTSLEAPDNYAPWFKFKAPGSRSEVDIERAWYYLTDAQRATLRDHLPRVSNTTDEGEEADIHLGAPGTFGLSSGEHWDYVIKEHRGNLLAAAVDLWLAGGVLYGEEQKFLDVLEAAGMPMDRTRMDHPHAEFPAVMPVYLRITNPFRVPDSIPAVLPALRRAVGRQRAPRYDTGVDQWDKRAQHPRDWMDRLEADIAEGSSHAWTSIPDWVTRVLRDAGHDGIQDTGGKMGGAAHTVWVPFAADQVKSAVGNRGTFDPESDSILESRNLTPEQEAALAKAGLPVDHRSTLQRIGDALRDGWARTRDTLADGDANRQAVVDRFHGLRAAEAQVGLTDPEHSPYIAARMTAGLSSILESLLLYGAPEWNGGVMMLKAGTVGLTDALAPVKGRLDDWLGWMVGRRAQLLASQGRENNLSATDIQALLSLAGPDLPAFQSAAREYLKIKNAVLDVAEQAGLIDPVARAAWDHAEYIPFYRAENEGTIGPGTRKGLAGQSSGIRTLKGGEQALADPLANIVRNFTRLLDAALKNRATLLAVDELGAVYFTPAPREMAPALIPLDQVKRHLANQGVPATTLAAMPTGALRGVQQMLSIVPPSADDVVRVMRDGKPHYYTVLDPLVLRALTSFREPHKNAAIKPFIFFKRLLTVGVTTTAEFVAANFIRDSGSAWVISDDRFKPGWDSIRGAINTLRNDATTQEMMMAGATFMGGQYYGGDADAAAAALRRALRAKGLSNRSIEGFMGTVARSPLKVWDTWLKFSSAIENANRRAVYDAAMKGGRTKTEAAYLARDLMDFSMQGDAAWVQMAGDVLPFFNARLQGMYKLGRRAGTKEGKQAILLRGGILTLFTLGLLAWNMAMHGDGYDELEEWDKDAYWHIAPGTPNHLRIPKPFELGVLFGTIPERISRSITGEDRSGQSFEAAWRAITGTLAINPIPQLALPALESFFNRKVFTGRPIENMGDEKLAPELREEWYTSDTAKLLSDVQAQVAPRPLQMSAKRIEHLWTGYTGGLGAYIMEASDAAVRWMTDAPDRPEPVLRDLPLVGRFARGGSPPASTRFTTEFYDLFQQAEEAEQTIKQYALEALPEGETVADPEALPPRAATIARKHAALLGDPYFRRGMKAGFGYEGVRALRKVRDQLSQLRQDADDVAMSESLSAAEKRKQLDALTQQRNDLVRETVRDVRGRER